VQLLCIASEIIVHEKPWTILGAVVCALEHSTVAQPCNMFWLGTVL